MMTDPIADLLARIRNAAMARLREVVVPSSKLKVAVTRVLAREGYLGEVRVESRDGRPFIVLELRYDENGAPMIDGLKRVSRPGRRVYVGAGEIPRVRSGLGVSVLSTSNGVLSDRAAREQSVGGELLCEVW